MTKHRLQSNTKNTAKTEFCILVCTWVALLETYTEGWHGSRPRQGHDLRGGRGAGGGVASLLLLPLHRVARLEELALSTGAWGGGGVRWGGARMKFVNLSLIFHNLRYLFGKFYAFLYL